MLIVHLALTVVAGIAIHRIAKRRARSLAEAGREGDAMRISPAGAVFLGILFPPVTLPIVFGRMFGLRGVAYGLLGVIAMWLAALAIRVGLAVAVG